MSKENKNEMRERSKESKARNKRNTDGDGYSCDSTLRPRAYARRRVKAQRKAEVKGRLRRWLEKLEDEGIQDPVPIVVGRAVKVTHGTKDDRNKWMKIANRGVNSFMGVLMEFEYDLEKPDMPRLRNLPSAFQARQGRFERSVKTGLVYPDGRQIEISDGGLARQDGKGWRGVGDPLASMVLYASFRSFHALQMVATW